MALNCTVVPTAADRRAGDTIRAVSVTGGVLVPMSVALADKDPEPALITALIVVVPSLRTAARPLLMVATTAVFVEPQVTWFVRSSVLLSE